MVKMQEHIYKRGGEIRFEQDKDIPREYFKAVIYACKMLYKGMPFNFAVTKASTCYGVDPDKVMEYLPEYAKQEQ